MTLFNDTDHSVTIDPEKNYFDELVGPDRPYKDEKALARGAAEKEAFILRLKKENEGLRGEISTRTRMEELLERLSSSSTPATITPVEPQAPQEPRAADVMTPEKVQELWNENERKRVADTNVTHVKQVLRAQWGSDYATKLREQAETLGLGENFMNSVAETNPQAFFRLVGLDRSRTETESGISLAPPRTQVNAVNFKPNTGEKKDYQYFENMRKSSDKAVRERYWSTSVQNEIHRLALANPEEFLKDS